MRRLADQTWFTTPVLLALFLAVWHAWIVVFEVSPFLVPKPADVGLALVELMQEPRMYEHLWFTIRGSFYGFVVASLVGMSLGVVLGTLPVLERALSPFIVATQVVPKIAFVPLFILWFGFGIESKVVIAMLLSFFPIFTNTLLGMKSVPTGHRDVMSALGSSRLRTFWSLKLPSSMPYVMSGLEVGIVFAVIGAIVAEYLGGSSGLGFMAISSLNALQVGRLFGVIVIMTVMGYAMYLVVVGMKRFTIPWHESVRTVKGAVP